MAKENYIKRLQRENEELRQEKAEALVELNELRRYLQTPKFWEDTTVQVGDVFDRLEPVAARLLN